MTKYLKPLIFHLIQLIAFIIFLKIMSHYCASFDGIGASTIEFFKFEIPLIILFYATIYSLLKDNKYRHVAASLPIYLFYIFDNIFYILLGRIFKLVDINELPELIDALPLSNILVAIVFIIILSALYGSLISYKNLKYRLILFLPVLLLMISIQLMPTLYVSAFAAVLPKISSPSDRVSAAASGYISFLLYNEARRVAMINELHSFRDRHAYENLKTSFVNSLNTTSIKRNVHVIVLESLLDPMLFKEITFSQSPFAEEFANFFHEKGSLSVSPVFGGGTAQAEFEVLCGVPAFQKFGIELNVFSGAKAYCMPEILKSIGYRVFATNASKPDYFNQVLGYKGTGFDEIYFPKENAPSAKTYFSKKTDDRRMTDGALLTQNLEYIEKHIKTKPEIPILNYVLGIYGHSPHILGDNRKPQVSLSSTNGKINDYLVLAVNQTYYRSKEIISYVKNLLTIDPESLIIIVSDHLPHLQGIETYTTNKYLDLKEDYIHKVRAYIVENGEPKNNGSFSHFHVPNIVYNYLTNGKFCEKRNCFPEKSTLVSEYKILIAHASE